MNLRVFTAFLVVGLGMLVVASYLVLGVGQARLRDAWGLHLRQVADQTAASVDAYVYRRIIDATVLARIPQVRDAAAADSRQAFDRNAALVYDRDWQQAGAPPPTVRAILGNKTSGFLADVAAINPIYRELLLTDRYGRLVAASGTTSNYLQSDEPWWREGFGDGVRGHLVVGDARYDDSSRSWGIEIVAPVEDPAGGSVVGVLKAVADIREVGALLGGVRMGQTGDAVLLHEDGSFVLGLRPIAANARFFAADMLRERLAAIQQGQPQGPLHFGATAADGSARLVGVAASQLKASYPHLNWLVAVSQADEELFAPVRAEATSLLVVLGLTALAVVLFALWYSVRLAAPTESAEMDMHLVRHPHVHRMEEPEEAEAEEEPVKETV
jgi:hypothetical protein